MADDDIQWEPLSKAQCDHIDITLCIDKLVSKVVHDVESDDVQIVKYIPEDQFRKIRFGQKKMSRKDTSHKHGDIRNFMLKRKK